MEVYLPALLICAIPLIMLFLFRPNMGVMFFAACTGLVLLQSLDGAVVTTAGSVVPGEGEAFVRLAVVLVSMVFAGLMFKSTQEGVSLVLSGLIAVILGVVLWLLLPESTNLSLLTNSRDNQIWRDLDSFRSIIIAAGFSLSLVLVLMNSKKVSNKK